MYKVSVIIPVYNVEKYIERCARSLFSQTLRGIEFIFIDDCTPDDSMAVLDRVIKEYQPDITGNNWQVRIVSMPANSGQAAVRRHGIQLATGEFIAHCDSDDWVDPNMYSLLYQKAKDTDADIVICDYYCSDGIHKETFISAFSENKDELLNQLLFEKGNWAIWDTLVKRECYLNKEIVFPKDNMGEDFALLTQLLFYSNTVCHLPLPLYYYFDNGSSITHQTSKEKKLSIFEQGCNNIQIVQKTLEKDIKKRYSDGIINVLSLQRNLLAPFIWEKDYFPIWENRFPGLTYKVLFNHSISLKHKLSVVMCYLRRYFACLR